MVAQQSMKGYFVDERRCHWSAVHRVRLERGSRRRQRRSHCGKKRKRSSIVGWVCWEGAMVCYAVWHELRLWRGSGDVLCGAITIFKFGSKENVICKRLGDRVGLSPGTGKSPGNSKNERSKKTSWSHRFNCCCFRYVPEAGCSRDDPARRAKLRLVLVYVLRRIEAC